VVEVLHVPQVRHRRPDVRVQVGGAVPGDLQVVCCRQCRAADELGDAAAPASISRAESASDQLYSPAATSGRTCCRTAARPARSCEDTGSSNQLMPIAASSSATRMAWPAE